jgi:hypothetical protein
LMSLACFRKLGTLAGSSAVQFTGIFNNLLKQMMIRWALQVT